MKSSGQRERAVFVALCVLLSAFLLVQFAPALSQAFSGDDFELLSLARTGGLRRSILPAPRRGMFIKPLMSAVWALAAALLGPAARGYYALLLATHLANALLLGLLAASLERCWGSPEPANPGPLPPGALGSAAWTGLATAAIWAAHDRLAEPLYSISAWNHSLTFTLYLSALLCLLGSLRTHSRPLLLLSGLLALAALLSYEVALSLLAAGLLLAVLHPAGSVTSRLRFALPAILAAGGSYALLRWVIGLQGGQPSYHFIAWSLAPRNFSEIGLAFLRVRSGWLSPGAIPAAALAILLLLGLILIKDRVARFGLGWFLVSSLVASPIPDYSDRYHYIPFAGLALATGRLAAFCLSRAARPDPIARHSARTRWSWVVGAVIAVHLAWGFAGSKEQAGWYGLKARAHGALAEQAARALEREEARPGSIVALVWRHEPGRTEAHRLAAAAGSLPARFGGWNWPVYVRPQAVLGLVAPVDLLNVARAGRSEFYKEPEPAEAARAIMERSLIVIPLDGSDARVPPLRDDPSLRRTVPEQLAESLRARREIAREIPAGGRPEETLRIAYVQRTDRSGAAAWEFRPAGP